MGVFEELDEKKQQLMKQHLQLVMKANEGINLTRIHSFEEGMILHIEDSLTALEEVENAPEGRLVDIGSGAGFPGIPLAIATGRETLLVDARQKKMKTAQSIIEELGLQDTIEVYSGRAELLARKQSNQYSVVTARALSKLSVLMELASPLLEHGGHLVCYKAHVDKEEFENAQKIEKLVGMKQLSYRTFRLNEEFDRCIIVFEKNGKPKLKLPRLEGEAQNHPL